MIPKVIKEMPITYTFATIKDKHNNVFLLAKLKSATEKYRFVCQCGCIVKFKTKASAHNAAKGIYEYGLKDSGYELGETY